jgi:hypothetical protein
MNKSEISFFGGIVMIGVALLFDIMEMILSVFSLGTISFLMGIIQYTLMFFWFKFYGGSFFLRRKNSGSGATNDNVVKNSNRNSLAGNNEQSLKASYSISLIQVAGFIAELMPLVGSLPIYTYNVWSQKNAHNKEVLENKEANKRKQEKNSNIIRANKQNR